MIFIMQDTNKILILFTSVFILVVRASAKFPDVDFEDYVDEDISASNESLPIISSTKIKNSPSKTSPLSSIIKALSTKHTSLNVIHNTKSSISIKKQSTSISSLSSTTITPRKVPMTAPPITPYVLVSYLVDQFNHYRNIDILSRIKQCDSNLKLNDMCEIYSFDNHTYSLVRESYVEFQSLKHLYNTLIDQMTVEKLNKFCPTGQWCLGNLTQDDIRFILDVLRQRGRSFCSLEKCHHRLAAQTTACSSITTKNISTPVLKLLPMLCTLYQEQQIWSTTKCIDEIAHLLHILFAFWPQLETCHHIIAAGSGGCTSECLTFDAIFHKVESQCNKNISFLTRVPTLAWYRSINLKQICRHEITATKPPFISSVKNFISSNVFWYRLHQRPVYAALFIIIVISIVISFSLCLYVMSKNDYDSSTRRFDDDYEYTRLHDSTFELGANTEITNANSASGRGINESQFDANGNHHLSEQQRLLYMES